jgi:hypothetical protein
VIFSIELSRLRCSGGMYNGLLNRCVLDEPVSGRSCQATIAAREVRVRRRLGQLRERNALR